MERYILLEKPPVEMELELMRLGVLPPPPPSVEIEDKWADYVPYNGEGECPF